MELLKRSYAKYFLGKSFITSGICMLVLIFCIPLKSIGLRDEPHIENAKNSPTIDLVGSEHGNEKNEEDHGNPWSLIWKWGNFVLLFGGLAYYLRQPLRDFLNARAHSIEQGLITGKKTQKEASEKIAEVEARLAGISNEIEALKVKAIKEGEDDRARVINDARLEAEKILALAKREIEGLQRSAYMELKAEVAELTVKIAEKQLKSGLGPAENQKIMSRFIQSLKEK